MQSVQQVFEGLVKKPNITDSYKKLEIIAYALWYSDFMPNIDNLICSHAAQAGFILDKLTRYNCLCKTKKQQIRSQLLPRLKVQIKNSPSTSNRDKLAQEWNVHFVMKQEFKSLLPMQRRSFEHKKTTVEKFSSSQ